VPDGRLYLTWADSADGQIRLTTSTDGADTWSTPETVSIPGVAWATKPSIAVRGPGDVALACWGSSRFEPGAGDGWLAPDGRPYEGYAVTCRDLFAAEPVFVSAVVRDEGAPLLPDGESFHGSGEYLGAPAFGPDGAVWAGFLCHAGDKRDGVVMRLRPAG
jgi:hypothetical protein